MNNILQVSSVNSLSAPMGSTGELGGTVTRFTAPDRFGGCRLSLGWSFHLETSIGKPSALSIGLQSRL